LDGRIGKNKINIMIDTGASSCVCFKSFVDKCGLEYLLDISTQQLITGAHSTKYSLGKIWYFEIQLNMDNNWIDIPISATIIDNTSDEFIKDNTSDEFIKDNDENINSMDIILGMTFLKSYKANINFSQMILTLNDKIKIKFK
jgi:hypothetical protein